MRIVDDHTGKVVVDTDRFYRTAPPAHLKPIKGVCFRKAAIGPEPLWLTRKVKEAWRSTAATRLKKWLAWLIILATVAAIAAVAIIPSDVAGPLREQITQYLP